MRLHDPVRRIGCFLVLTLACAGLTAKEQSEKKDLDSARTRLAQEVRHKLLMLPNYNVFDDLKFEITEISTVVLMGQVTRPSLKSNAETAILGLEGVGKLVDKIEVLPLSPSDDRLRQAAFHAIFSRPGLEKYGIRAVPPIHIIVQDGNITLLGTVANAEDKGLVGIAVQEVPGALHVTNNLKIENR